MAVTSNTVGGFYLERGLVHGSGFAALPRVERQTSTPEIVDQVRRALDSGHAARLGRWVAVKVADASAMCWRGPDEASRTSPLPEDPDKTPGWTLMIAMHPSGVAEAMVDAWNRDW